MANPDTFAHFLISPPGGGDQRGLAALVLNQSRERPDSITFRNSHTSDKSVIPDLREWTWHFRYAINTISMPSGVSNSSFKPLLFSLNLLQ